MTNYTVIPIHQKIIPPNQYPDEVMKYAPPVAGLCHERRLVQHLGTNFFHWEIQIGGNTGPWQVWSPLMERRPIRKQNRCFICKGDHLPDECPKRGR